MPILRCLFVLYESEAACLERLAGRGLTGKPAREIACYLAQATDLPAFYERIRAAFAPSGVGVDCYEIDEAAEYLPALLADPKGAILWNLTDGFRY